MISNKNVANAVGGKTARACDSCIKKRARWYCAADDAFLCQACDGSVHSANPLARRHERVRLKTASHKSFSKEAAANSPPSWHGGFTRKARTPRHGKFFNKLVRNSLPLVPELANSDEISHEENEEEHLLYRVPIYDPFAAELCTSGNHNEAAEKTTQNEGEMAEMVSAIGSESKVALRGSCGSGDVDSLHGFQFPPSDMELAEFAADVENLLGRGLENESFVAMEELGLMDYNDNNSNNKEEDNKVIKVEEEILGEDDDEMREPFELNFDYDSDQAGTCGDADGDHQEEEEEEKGIKREVVMESTGGDGGRAQEDENGTGKKKKRKISLRLDYEAVINAWATHNTSPWTTGDRPDFDPDECWPACMGTCGTEMHRPHVGLTGIGSHPAVADEGREARVSRYREKRRTRLFSKKIRYEVRKLNAEKRPRMKGRFVKRASFAGAGPPPTPPAFPNLLIGK